jgi:beta-glucosidase
VVSDCGAVRNIFDGHHYEPTQAQASAISLERGMDNECVDFTTRITDDHDYKPYLDAVKEGYLKESDIDRALIRLFAARMKLGMFDPPSMVPYTKIDESELNSPAHRALALKLANESMVLLKNDGTLPLKTSGIKIAVIGPLADQTPVLLGNYNGIPTHTVSILEGIKAEFAGDSIQYVPGTQFLGTEFQPVPSALLTAAGQPGVKATYLQGDIATFLATRPNLTLLASRTEPNIDASAQPLPPEAASVRPLAVRWETTLTPQATGDYDLGLQADGFFSVSLDGQVIANDDDTHGFEPKLGRVHLEAGKPYQLAVDYSPVNRPAPRARLIWTKIDYTPDPAAIHAARSADVTIAVVGITSQLEGEEMKIDLPGFKGGDRTSLNLPQPEEDLLKALAATRKPLVVVLTNGSALAVNWASTHVNAILDAWYPGEEGGAAVAQTLSGRNNPAGRLPVTFYKGIDQLPPFDDYSMKNRTYRYFTGAPLYPFGYGLSYTSFSYSGLHLPAASIKAGDPLSAEVTITNRGKIDGDEVAELYLTFPAVPGAPLRALRAFTRVHLAAGASVQWRFSLTPRDMSMVTEAGEPVVAAGAYTVSVGGGQPGTGAPTVSGSFNVEGTMTLPE